MRSRILNDDKFDNDIGMKPVRLLFPRYKILRLVSLLPNSEGTRPLSWFQRRSMIIRLVQELRLAGSGPEKAFRVKLRIRRWPRRPRLSGMLPLNPLWFKLRILSEDRLPTAGERTPVSPWDGRLSATTRRCLPRHLTPSQLQYPPSVLPFQEVSALLLLPIAAALKASSAASPAALAARSVEKNMEVAISNSSKHAERISMPGALVGLCGIDGRCNWCTTVIV